MEHDVDKVRAQLRDQAAEDQAAEYRARMSETEEFGFLNIRGQEVPDPTPMEPPIGYQAQPDLMEMIRAMVQREIHLRDDAIMESPEEADDFEEDDAEDFDSPYELFFNPEPGAPAGPPPSPVDVTGQAPKPAESAATPAGTAPPEAPG